MEYFQSLEFWSKFMFWFVNINIVLTMFFTVVVVIGGIFDLKFLLKALRTEVTNDKDNGSIGTSPASTEKK
jgi:hypothetical protein